MDLQQPVIAFLPCRKGSQRVIRKNTRPFAGREGGLAAIKLRQLSEATLVERIVVSTDDRDVMEIAEAARNISRVPIEIHERPEHLASSRCTTDELIGHVPSIIPGGAVLWTHVTSPFVGAGMYDEAVRSYREGLLRGKDSLMSVSRLQTFLWSEDGPVNYDRSATKWPFTQSLPVWYEVNSAIFIADITVYREHGDRIGQNPGMMVLKGLAIEDVDTEEDFARAERLWKVFGEDPA